MALDRQKSRAVRKGLPFPAVLAIGALAVFGALTMVQWFLSSVIGIAKFGLFVVVVVTVGAWVISAKGRR